MANVRKYIQIDPINDRENVAIGIRFPFNAEGVFYSTYTTKEQAKNNLINIFNKPFHFFIMGRGRKILP